MWKISINHERRRGGRGWFHIFPGLYDDGWYTVPRIRIHLACGSRVMEAFGKLMASPLLLLSISSSPRVSITGTLKLFSSSLNLEKWSLSRGWIEAERERKRKRERWLHRVYIILYILCRVDFIGYLFIWIGESASVILNSKIFWNIISRIIIMLRFEFSNFLFFNFFFLLKL